MESLSDKISKLKVGDYLDLSLSVHFQGQGFKVQLVTEKAIKVNGDWIPKSQIVGISYGHSYKGIESNTEATECIQININDWFDKKLAKNAKSSGFAY